MFGIHQVLELLNMYLVHSIVHLCLIPCNPMDCCTPGLPVHHQLPELTQSPVCWVSDAIQPSYPLSSPSPPTFNVSQNQGLFQWISPSHQVAKVLKLQLQHQSFQMNIQDWFPLGVTGWISLLSKGLSSLLLHHGSKASVLQQSAFFRELDSKELDSYPYMTTEKNHRLD